jgi:hypothetical protein
MKPNNALAGIVLQENVDLRSNGHHRRPDNRQLNGKAKSLRPERKVTHAIQVRAQPTTLEPVEKRQRCECEEIIRKGWDTFLEVGRALAAIRDKRLYRDRYATFDEYCQQKWDFSKTHANRLIEAASVAAALTPIGVKLKSESQVRPLVGLPALKIPAAWKRAEQIAGEGEITAKVVRQAAEEFKTEPKKSAVIAPANKSTSIPAGLKAALKLLYEAEESARIRDVLAVLETLRNLRKCLLDIAKNGQSSVVQQSEVTQESASPGK